jgi:putative CocE/NonD family hydrolase
VISAVDRDPGLQLLIAHGYVIAAVDVRGGGASFGTYAGTFSPEETRDAYELTEWFAAQPWCDGNIGMYGGSYLGITQLMAASEAPPHLKAIFPQVAAFDLFSFVREGGIYREGFIQLWGDLTKRLDTEVPPVPVDGDEDGLRLKKAVVQHAGNWDVIRELEKNRFRDDGALASLDRDMPSARIEAINASGIPIYACSGWYDIYTRDPFQMFANFTNPVKVMMGPWPHGYWNDQLAEERGRLVNSERLRWFDYWLKGIRNGILDEPPIHYAVIRTPGESWDWRTADSWPPAAEPAVYYFQPGPSGSVASVNDGRLAFDPPGPAAASDAYAVDYSATSGEQTRWHCGAGVELNYPDMAANDRKVLTYTSDILEEDITVVGHPLLTLFLSSNAEDADILVYLEEVDAEGRSFYITEGQLRASCRALGAPPYDNLGLPFHPVSKDDVRKLEPGKPAELVVDLLPVSNIFDKGHRIRVAVAGADAGMARVLRYDPPPAIRLHRGGRLASRIQLPILR